MRIVLGEIHGKEMILELDREGIVYLNGEAEPIKNLTEADLRAFQAEVDALPATSDEDGYKALVNAIRAAFLARLLGHAVGDECISRITHILDHVHYDVLKYLGETDEEDQTRQPLQMPAKK